jgi:hemolysin III
MKNKNKGEEPFSKTRFAIIVSMTLVVYGILIYAFAPGIFKSNVNASVGKWFVVFLATHLVCAFVEFFFHRYVLHKSFWFLGKLNKQHELHHRLTSISLEPYRSGGRGKVMVVNRYPIIKDDQNEASYFPWYSLSGFILVAMIIAIPLQIYLLPSWPILCASAIAIAWSIVSYEIIHMIEHFSFEDFWQKKVEHPRWGGFWKSVYSFHLRHHANVRCNEGIGGFFGLPVADWIFGTYSAPWSSIFKDGEIIHSVDYGAHPSKPRMIIRFLDRLFVKA